MNNRSSVNLWMMDPKITADLCLQADTSALQTQSTDTRQSKGSYKMRKCKNYNTWHAKHTSTCMYGLG